MGSFSRSRICCLKLNLENRWGSINGACWIGEWWHKLFPRLWVNISCARSMSPYTVYVSCSRLKFFKNIVRIAARLLKDANGSSLLPFLCDTESTLLLMSSHSISEDSGWSFILRFIVYLDADGALQFLWSSGLVCSVWSKIIHDLLVVLDLCLVYIVSVGNQGQEPQNGHGAPPILTMRDDGLAQPPQLELVGHTIVSPFLFVVLSEFGSG